MHYKTIEAMVGRLSLKSIGLLIRYTDQNEFRFLLGWSVVKTSKSQE